jgi:hypothetical protein
MQTKKDKSRESHLQRENTRSWNPGGQLPLAEDEGIDVNADMFILVLLHN